MSISSSINEFIEKLERYPDYTFSETKYNADDVAEEATDILGRESDYVGVFSSRPVYETREDKLWIKTPDPNAEDAVYEAMERLRRQKRLFEDDGEYIFRDEAHAQETEQMLDRIYSREKFWSVNNERMRIDSQQTEYSDLVEIAERLSRQANPPEDPLDLFEE